MAVSNPFLLESFNLLGETITAAGTLAKCRFVKRTGAYVSSAGDYAAGVLLDDAASGDKRTIQTEGIAIVEAGGAISVDGPVKSTTAGKALAQGGSGTILGYALDEATGSGTEFIRVKLTV